MAETLKGSNQPTGSTRYQRFPNCLQISIYIYSIAKVAPWCLKSLGEVLYLKFHGCKPRIQFLGYTNFTRLEGERFFYLKFPQFANISADQLKSKSSQSLQTPANRRTRALANSPDGKATSISYRGTPFAKTRKLTEKPGEDNHEKALCSLKKHVL